MTYHNTTETKECPESHICVCLNQKNKSELSVPDSIVFFSIASYCIKLHCVESNRNWIALHHNRGESYRIISHRIGSCFICIFNVSYLWLCIEIMELRRCTSLSAIDAMSNEPNLKGNISGYLTHAWSPESREGDVCYFVPVSRVLQKQLCFQSKDSLRQWRSSGMLYSGWLHPPHKRLIVIGL